MLVGRTAECESLRGVLADARAGRAGVLVLRGEAGIGKTRLLDFTQAAADGFRVLRIQGHECESEIAFAGLTWLAEPLAELSSRLPAAQAEALDAALHLGSSRAGDRLAVGIATLTLLASAAEERPVLVAVDDAHLLDLPSLEAMVFAARRLQAESIAVVMTAHPAEDVRPEAERLLAGLPRTTVTGLDERAARELLASRHAGVPPGVIADWVSASAGNPLVLLELPATAGTLPIEPLRIGHRLEQAFGRRISAVPPPTRRAMLLLAAAGTSAPDVLDRALRLQGMSTADLEPAEAAGLLDDGGTAFRHPLIRSALYHSASPAERRAAHRALAGVFAGFGTPGAQERHAWHLAAATVVPDAGVAAVLTEAAGAAAARRSYATAMAMFERAAQLSPPGDERAGRLMHAANLGLPAGNPRAGLPLLERVLTETADWRVTAEATHLRCRIEMWTGRPVAARDDLLAQADRIAALDPGWAAVMRAHAALTSVSLNDQSLAVRAGREAVESLTGLPDEVTMPALLIQALILAISGDVDEARSLLDRCTPYLEEWDPLASDQLLLVAGLAWTSLEEPKPALYWLERASRAAREAGAVGLLPFQLSWLALARWRDGDWARAWSTAHDAVTFADEAGWQTELPNCLVALATIEATLGRAEDCRAHAAQAVELGRETGVDVIEARAAKALALLALGTGDTADAVRHLEQAAAFATSRGLGDTVLFNWAGDQVEALVQAGEPDRAAAPLAVLVAEAERTRRPTQRALAARCRGLLAGDEDTALDELASALHWHAQAAQPFEEARTRLVYGQLLRRFRRRAKARAELTTALAVFERLGAAPWADRTRAELRATGLQVGRRGVPEQQRLTPQELRVALVVAEGLPNAEAAAHLFLSAKTVEYHLSSVYRKLGIRSRSQLARALASAGGEQA